MHVFHRDNICLQLTSIILFRQPTCTSQACQATQLCTCHTTYRALGAACAAYASLNVSLLHYITTYVVTINVKFIRYITLNLSISLASKTLAKLE